jgi:hypothetical protein
MPQEVYDHLTDGSEMLEGYTDWVCHGEKINASHSTKPIIEGMNSTQIDRAPNLDEHNMLHDVFRMHDGKVDEGGSEMGAEVESMEGVQEDTDD